MKPIVLTAEQRKGIERRRKETLDRRVYQRLTAVLAVASGKSREEVAELLGVSLSQLDEWLRVFRNSDPIRHWAQKAFAVTYSPSGVKGMLRGGGISYHQVTGFL